MPISLHDPLVPIISTLSLLNFTLGFLVLGKNFQSKVHQIFCALAASIGLWSITILLLAIISKTLFWAKLVFAFGALTALFFLLFSYYFPRPRLLNPRHQWLIIIIGSIFISLSLTNLVCQQITPAPTGINATLGPLYLPYLFYFTIFMIWGLINLQQQRQSATIVERQQIFYVFLGFFIAIPPVLTTNLILPILTGQPALIQFGPCFSIFVIVFTSYAILKHHLLGIKVLAVEILVSLIIFTAYLEIFLARNITELIWRFIFLLGLTLIGIFLIRAMIKEKQLRERMEKLARELKIANVRLTELSESKSTFVSVTSHQLKTPITGIQGYISMLKEGDYGQITKKQRNVLDKSLRNIKDLIRFVDVFLDVTNIEAGKIKFTKENVQLEDLIKEVIADLSPLARFKNLSLKIKTPAHKLPLIFVDAERMKHVIFNMLDNAIKYTTHGQITISVRQHGKNAIVEVHDTGIGIARQELSKLFKKFVRAGGSLQIGIRGAGLGLYIIKSFINAHGGQVWVKSPGVGQGATFGFSIEIANISEYSLLNARSYP